MEIILKITKLLKILHEYSLDHPLYSKYSILIIHSMYIIGKNMGKKLVSF